MAKKIIDKVKEKIFSNRKKLEDRRSENTIGTLMAMKNKSKARMAIAFI